MKKNILKAKFLTDFTATLANMYRLGWDERNGGNLSVILEEDDVKKYLNLKKVIRTIPLGFYAPTLVGKIFMVTGTGKYFKNAQADPANNVGIVRIAPDGKTAELLWGFADGGKFTSEFPAHLMSHVERLKIDENHRVIMHSHPTNVLAMTFVHDLDEREFTRTLWKMITECMVVFPDGVGVLPWMICGTNEIGEVTAEKMKKYRLCVWAQHGIFGAGKDLDEAFGLLETVEEAAEVYLKIKPFEILAHITDDQFKQIAERFSVVYPDGWVK